MKVVLRDYSSASSTNTEATAIQDGVALDRLIYRVLGSLTDNKVITVPSEVASDRDRLLLDMENLSTNPIPDIIELDKYLSTLGITERFPFYGETYSIESWIDPMVQDPYRSVIDGTLNVMYGSSNVVHKTGV